MARQFPVLLTGRSKATLGAAVSLGVCAAACLVPVLLALFGVSAGAALVCNVYEAAPLVVIGGAGAVGAVAFFRKRAASEGACGCAGTGSSDDSPTSGVPIACDLSVFTPEERAEHFVRSRRLFSLVEQLRDEADGFTFTFAATPTLVEDVSHWVANEKQCCPFFRFDVAQPGRGTLVLRVSGPGAAKSILRAGLEEYGLGRS